MSVAKQVVERLVESGHVAYYAGGWVRDMLLGHPSSDIDIATSATPDEVMALFEKTVPVGLQFGSVVVVEEGESFEVTTFRTEGGYQDGRHPDTIAFASAEEDAKRRSLTINGMFYDPLRDEVIDFVGGQEDLKLGIIRAIGNPDERFTEDKLRMVRAVRFATRFDFTIEPETAKAIEAHAHELFPAVAIERVWQELTKMGHHSRFRQFLEALHHFHLLQQVFPELKGQTLELEPLDRFPEEAPTIARVMELFPEPSEEVARRLKVSNEDLALVALLQRLDALPDDPVEQVHFYAEPRAQLCLQIRAARLGPSFLAPHLERQEQLAPHIERRRNRQPLVTSKHLIAKGIQPGPEMGEMLRRAERIAIERDLNTPEAVLEDL